jgi:hypothetical protein
MPRTRQHDRADGADPWFKFFGRDWQGDELLSLCSYAARGLLVDLICLMHRSTRYGYLLVNGVPPTDLELARLTHGARAEVRHLRRELLEKGVLSTDSEGIYFSRRMVREQARSALARAHGALGGNPALKKTSAIASGKNGNEKDKREDNHIDGVQDNADDKTEDIPQIQIQSTYSRTRDPGSSTASVQTAAARRHLRIHENKPLQKLATHRVLCAMARAASAPGQDYSAWAEAVKLRLAKQGYAYPTPHALTAALDAVFHVEQSRKA